MSPELIMTGISLLTAAWQAIRAKRWHDATDVLTDAIEVAAKQQRNPKSAVAVQAAGTIVGYTIDKMLRKKGILRISK